MLASALEDSDPFSKLPIEKVKMYVEKYRKQILAPKTKLMLAPCKIGDKLINGYGVIDTGCTSTLMSMQIA